MQVRSSYFFLCSYQAFLPTRGFSPRVLLLHSIDASTRVVFGINEASLLRHEITPILVAPLPFSQAAVYLSLVSIVLSGFLS